MVGGSFAPLTLRSGIKFPLWAVGLRNDAENRAIAVGGGPIRGGPIQGPIRSLNQRCSRILAIRASRLRAKAVERGQRAAHSYFEDRPATVGPTYSQNVVPYKLPLRGPDESDLRELAGPRKEDLAAE